MDFWQPLSHNLRSSKRSSIILENGTSDVQPGLGVDELRQLRGGVALDRSQASRARGAFSQ